MPRLPSRYAAVILAVAPLFIQRSRRHAALPLAGVILAPGQRTVTTILRITGLAPERRFLTNHRVLSRAAWCPRAASRLLFGLFSIVTLLGKQLTPLARRATTAGAWYNKQRPTFFDTFAAVRGDIWREQGFVTSRVIAHVPRSGRAVQGAGCEGATVRFVLRRGSERESTCPWPRRSTSLCCRPLRRTL